MTNDGTAGKGKASLRVCLIDPPGIVKGLNLGLGYLASSLIREGHQVRVLDLNNNNRGVKERLAGVRDFDVVGVSVKSSTANAAGRIAKAIGRKDLVCGGAHITIDGCNFLERNLSFRGGVVGEGEETLCEIVRAVEDGVSLRGIKGVIFREGDEIATSPRRPFVDNLDSLPDPNYEVFDSFKGSIGHYPLITSKGCPYSCVYCCVSEVSGRRWRTRSPERLIEELRRAKSKYGSKSFEIVDDNFTFDLARAKRFCRLLIEHRLGLNWACYNGIRADRLDEELVALMRTSGCNAVSIGVESLDNDVFGRIGKGETLEDIRRAVHLLKKYRIEVDGSFIIGLPGDSLSKTLASVRLCNEMHFDKTMWNLFVPYPGTRAWKWVSEEGRILRDWNEGFHFGTGVKPVFETDDFTEAERVRAYTFANAKCKGYFALMDAEKSLVGNVVDIGRLVLKYDSRNLLSHVSSALRSAVEFRHRIKEFEKIA